MPYPQWKTPEVGTGYVEKCGGEKPQGASALPNAGHTKIRSNYLRFQSTDFFDTTSGFKVLKWAAKVRHVAVCFSDGAMKRVTYSDVL